MAWLANQALRFLQRKKKLNKFYSNHTFSESSIEKCNFSIKVDNYFQKKIKPSILKYKKVINIDSDYVKDLYSITKTIKTLYLINEYNLELSLEIEKKNKLLVKHQNKHQKLLNKKQEKIIYLNNKLISLENFKNSRSYKIYVILLRVFNILRMKHR